MTKTIKLNNFVKQLFFYLLVNLTVSVIIFELFFKHSISPDNLPLVRIITYTSLVVTIAVSVIVISLSLVAIWFLLGIIATKVDIEKEKYILACEEYIFAWVVFEVGRLILAILFQYFELGETSNVEITNTKWYEFTYYYNLSFFAISPIIFSVLLSRYTEIKFKQSILSTVLVFGVLLGMFLLKMGF